MPASVLEKDFAMDVLLHKNFEGADVNADANAEIFKWPTINSLESLTKLLLFLLEPSGAFQKEQNYKSILRISKKISYISRKLYIIANYIASQ